MNAKQGFELKKNTSFSIAQYTGMQHLQEDDAAVKAEKPEEKKKSGVKARAGKHAMTFDTLKTLQLAGWLSLFFAFPIFRHQSVSSFLFYR